MLLFNLCFVIVEATYGILAHSVALLADAGHNSSDVLSLVLAWGASLLSRRQPTRHYTYGLSGSSILVSLLNAILLLLSMEQSPGKRCSALVMVSRSRVAR